MKVKIFSNSGETIYSSDSQDIGEITQQRYFHEIVAKGSTRTQVLRKGRLSSEGQIVTADVVETYIPIMRDGTFMGAFELYYDITAKREALNKLISRSSTVLFMASFGFLVVILIVSFRVAKAEDALRGAHDELERKVEERTFNLKAANEELQSEISERKLAEESLRESEERFRSMTQSAIEAVISADSTGRILSWNDAAQTIFCYTEEEVLGKPLAILMPEQYREAHQMGLERVAKGGEFRIIGRTVELEGLRKDGSEFPVEISLSAWKSRNETFYGAIIRDITERKRMEQELLRAKKLASLEVLSSGAAHEINNPLNVIALNLQMFLKDEFLEPERRLAYQEMMGQIECIREVVRSLDIFAQQVKVERQPVAIQEELKEVLSNIEEEARRCGVEVTGDFLPTSPVVMGDPSLIQRAFKNILDNALKAMPQGGTMTIQTRETAPGGEPRVDIHITDTGVGIRPEHLDKIFDPFFSTREVGKGKGLDLSIALGIVEDHAGTISVESREGRGTSLTVSIPLLKGERQSL